MPTRAAGSLGGGSRALLDVSAHLSGGCAAGDSAGTALDGTLRVTYPAAGNATVYDDPRQPARPARPSQGQRCPGCGHTEPDLAARFCGVCGASLPGLQAHGPGHATGQGHEPANQLRPVAAQYPQTPAQYGAHAAPPAPVMATSVPSPAYGNPGGYGGAPAAPQPINYTVPSVGFAGPARLGAAVSAAFMLVPCVLFAFLGSWAVHAGRRLMDSWLTASIPISIPLATINLPMNFVDLLRMRPFYNTLIYWDERLWLTFAILWLTPWIVWIVAGAFFALILAAIYNMVGSAGGGVSVMLQPRGTQASAAQQGTPQGAGQGSWQQPGWPPDRRG